MKCPYLSSASKKECVKMLAENMDGDLSEFDLKHFCDGNPVFCYYFRAQENGTAVRLQRADPELAAVTNENLCLKEPILEAQGKTHGLLKP